jgi:hypothetical protein
MVLLFPKALVHGVGPLFPALSHDRIDASEGNNGGRHFGGLQQDGQPQFSFNDRANATR